MLLNKFSLTQGLSSRKAYCQAYGLWIQEHHKRTSVVKRVNLTYIAQHAAFMMSKALKISSRTLRVENMQINRNITTMEREMKRKRKRKRTSSTRVDGPMVLFFSKVFHMVNARGSKAFNCRRPRYSVKRQVIICKARILFGDMDHLHCCYSVSG